VWYLQYLQNINFKFYFILRFAAQYINQIMLTFLNERNKVINQFWYFPNSKSNRTYFVNLRGLQY